MMNLRKLALMLVIFASMAVLAVGVWSLMRDYGDTGDEYVFYTVSKADLPIIVTERGNLEAQLETAIRCEVESLTRDSSGNYGTQIIFIVPNGSAVEEGDLLVELDSTAIREKRDEQVLRHKRAESALIQAQARHDNQVLSNETALAEAKLDVQLAELAKQMYEDPKDGTYRLAVEDIDRDIDDANNLVLEAQASLELAKTDLAGIEELFRLGYRGQRDVTAQRLSLMKEEDKLAANANRLLSHESKLRQLDNYERKMETLRLAGSVQTATRMLKQVENDNISKLAQAVASLDEATAVEEKERERLENYEEQLTKTKIYAPHGGMVVYAREGRYNSTEIAEGVNVRQRQRILTLPNLNRMQVKTQVHEAVLDQVRPGLPASVRIDAFPDELYYAVVNDVAVVPASSHYGSAVKTYETVVHIDGEVENLKPGMTAVVEIHVDRIKDVLTVPVQAVVQREKENWCYVDMGKGVERRNLDLGRSNDKFVQIQGGLGEGDRIVLNPMSILDEIESGETEISPEIGEPDEMPESVARSLKEQGEQIMAEREQAAKAPPGGVEDGPGGGFRGPDGMTKRPGGPARGGARPASAPGGPRPPRTKGGQRKPPQAAGISTVAPISKSGN